jgi:hypothetical protein
MRSKKTTLHRVLSLGFLVIVTGVFCQTTFAISPGWPGTPAIAATASYPAVPATPATYLKITTIESPYQQYRDTSMLSGTVSPYGPFTCVPAMYLSFLDPTNFVVVRTFEPRFPNNVYGPSQPVSSPAVSAQPNFFGQLADIQTTLIVYPHPENPYGRETLSFYSTDEAGNLKTLLETDKILVYPKSSAKILNAVSFASNPAPNPVPVASPSPYPNPSPYPLPAPSVVNSFIGDQARLNIEIYNAYAGGDTWIVVYPGTFSSTPPGSAKELPNSRLIAPITDMVPKRIYFYEIGTAKDTSGALLTPPSATPTNYTIQVLQSRSPYGQETLAAATFTVVNSSFQINSQLGKLTP